MEKYCKFCKTKLILKKGEYKSQLMRRIFCNHSCDAKSKLDVFKNTGRTRFKKGDERLIGNKSAEGNTPWNKGTKGVMKAWNKGKKVPQMSGVNNPAWKGGVRSANYIERRKFQQTVQKLVFERDNYKCTKCGKGGDLQVDHIQPWAEYVELRFDMNNCRTLCVSCHYELTFGRPMSDTVKGWGHNLLERVRIAK